MATPERSEIQSKKDETRAKAAGVFGSQPAAAPNDVIPIRRVLGAFAAVLGFGMVNGPPESPWNIFKKMLYY